MTSYPHRAPNVLRFSPPRLLSVLTLLGFFAACLPASAGLRIVSAKSLSRAAPLGPARLAAAASTGATPPLEGPLLAVAITVTDQHEGELEFEATAHAGVDGQPLDPGATLPVVIGVLDSGAATHLVSYADSLRLGLQGDWLTANTFPAEGAGGSVDLLISRPVGFFSHGLQDLDAAGNIRPDLTLGQGNFACGVNTLENEEAGSEIPTVLGAPFLLFFPAYVQNSQPIATSILGKEIFSPSVTFFADPDQVPSLDHRIFLEVRPSEGMVSYLALFDPDPFVPTVILAGFSAALFFTASDMVFTQGSNSSHGRMMVDTGAQTTVLGQIAAAELDLDLRHPEFEVQVQGVGGVETAPGFYVDSARVPAGGGAVSWSRIPVVILNVASPEGGTLYGIFGSNLIATRDVVFNGASSPPYLDVTDPIVSPVLRITNIRKPTPTVTEVDWRTDPAPPMLYLQMTDNLGLSSPQWTRVATGELATVTGTMSVTGLVSKAFFRLEAP
jgi:aspartyl protease